jgi:hypothetical protein
MLRLGSVRTITIWMQGNHRLSELPSRRPSRDSKTATAADTSHRTMPSPWAPGDAHSRGDARAPSWRGQAPAVMSSSSRHPASEVMSELAARNPILNEVHNCLWIS